MTGDRRAATGAMLALVQATAAAAERELLVARLRSGQRLAGRCPGLRLSVLRPSGPVLTVNGRPVHLSLRHAELLLLLAECPAGQSARELAVQLDERELDEVTVRAELSRLRRVVGPEVLRSRPYRLVARVATDVAEVRRALARGDLSTALHQVTAPLLAQSAAPGVARLRGRLEEEIRVALLGRDDPALLLRWVGGEDLEVRRRCRDRLPGGPARDRATARVRLLDREFGTG